MRIRARKLTNGSLLKLIFIGLSITLLPFMLICGIASVYGANTIRVNERPVTGIAGLITSFVMYPVFCVFFSAALWVIHAIGLWIYSMFSRIELEFVDAEVISSQSSGGTDPPQQIEPKTL